MGGPDASMGTGEPVPIVWQPRRSTSVVGAVTAVTRAGVVGTMAARPVVIDGRPRRRRGRSDTGPATVVVVDVVAHRIVGTMAARPVIVERGRRRSDRRRRRPTVPLTLTFPLALPFALSLAAGGSVVVSSP